MDEWADQDGNIAPIDYKAGFSHSQLKYFYGKIDEELRMPLSNIHYPTTENIKDYSKSNLSPIICGDSFPDDNSLTAESIF